MKQDEFSAQLATWTDFVARNRKQLSIGLSVGLGVLAATLGGYYFIRGQQNSAGAALAKALDTYHAPVMNATPPAGMEAYKTSEEKNSKALDEFTQVARDYSHYSAGRLARYYAAVCERDLGKYPDAERAFQEVADGGDKQLASLAKIGLASIYEQTNRTADAEKVYKDLEANPTDTVPKATALLARADLYSKTNPADATKLYQQIQKDYSGSPAGERAKQMLDKLPH